MEIFKTFSEKILKIGGMNLYRKLGRQQLGRKLLRACQVSDQPGFDPVFTKELVVLNFFIFFPFVLNNWWRFYLERGK